MFTTMLKFDEEGSSPNEVGGAYTPPSQDPQAFTHMEQWRVRG